MDNKYNFSGKIPEFVESNSFNPLLVKQKSDHLNELDPQRQLKAANGASEKLNQLTSIETMFS
jgi:hypothetical protein